MAKWYSSLFSDIRNKLGNQVVFGSWKGRGYFRQWVIPTNPKTAAQTAVRIQTKNIMALLQNNLATDAEKGVWNELALPELISGFNLAMKEGKKSSIACDGTGNTTDPETITYTVGFNVANAAVYAYDGTTLEDITPAEGLETGADKTFEHTFGVSGTYTLYVADTRPLVEGDSAPQQYQTVTNCSVDKIAGTSPIATIVIS